MIIGKTNIEQDNYDCLILCVRDNEYIQIPNFIKRICISSFDGYKKLDEIHIPSDSKLETIDEYAFCYTTIRNIIIPSSLTSIGKCAFSSCEQLEKIIIPSDSKLQKIGNGAFSSSKAKSITIPSSVISIGINAFNLKMLQIIEINNREMISIYEKSFKNCTNALLMIPSE